MLAPDRTLTALPAAHGEPLASSGSRERSPAYASGTLADVIPGALTALGMPGLSDPLGLASRLEGVRRVAVLLVDGMGWRQSPFDLDAMKITCGFPSTTPTSLVSLTTGASPGEHGILAFTTRIPGTDRVLNHTKWIDNPRPTAWQPIPPLFEPAAAAGIVVNVVNRTEYLGSGLSVVTTRGAQYLPAGNADEVATQMLAALDQPGLVYGYHPELDKAGHEYGLASSQWRKAQSEVETLVHRLIDGLSGDAALLVTADHGQLDVPADRRIDVDTAPGLADGVHLIAGEPRVRYVHAVPGAAADVLAAWRERAGHASWVGSREEAIEAGWYGPFNPAYSERLGDVVAICKDNWAFMASKHEPSPVMRLKAMHGALTPDEMEIPLIVIRGQ